MELRLRRAISAGPMLQRGPIDRAAAPIDALLANDLHLMPLKEAISSMPRLARMGGGCPCAKSVRWVQESSSN